MMTRPAGRRDIRSASRTYSSRASAAVAAQRRALRLAARDTRLLGIPRMSQSTYVSSGELKGMDTDCVYSPVLGTTGTNVGVITVNLVQAGTGSWNRIGRRITMKSLRLQGVATCDHFLDGTNDYLGNSLRIMVVYDRQSSQATEPQFNDIFGQTSQAGTETTNWYSPPKYDTMMRYVCLKDWSIDSQCGADPTATNFVRNVFHIDEYIRLPNLEVNFSGQSSPMTVADINTGALYVIARANQGTPAATVWILNLNARLRYVD